VSGIPYGRQEITEDDIAAVTSALRDPFLTQGPKVGAFEAALAERTGARFAVAVNSGTAALHAAYFAAGIGPGRTVLTTPITFAATANAALYLGAGVRFADVDPATVLLDPAAVAATDARDVAVLAPVHFTGHVAEIERLARTAAERGWTVVEDAAHALGASYTTSDGRRHRVGACAHSAMCCFSFHPVKHVTTGEGGAVTTNDETLYRKLLRFRTHGITRDPAELSRAEGAWYYEQLDLGFNYRITDFQCALGMSQLARLPVSVERRRQLAAAYDGAFGRLAGVRTIPAAPWSEGAYHLYVIRVPAEHRRRIFDRLRESGIGVNVHYIPVHRHPYYRRHGFEGVRFPHAEAYYEEAITLPMFPGLTDEQVARVVGAVSREVAEVGGFGSR
jgi:UDP-4-amino-4,6-dideoxy-N-acetyl-beta-L-altrosamine transaminase